MQYKDNKCDKDNYSTKTKQENLIKRQYVILPVPVNMLLKLPKVFNINIQKLGGEV
jgi:hypothetical protein